MSIPLRELEAEITRIDYGDGVVLDCLLFDCPNCNRQHSQLVPFRDEPFGEIPDPRSKPGCVQRPIKLWQRTGGSTVDDLTLAPSFLVPSCSGLHGYVRGGRWESC